jgi:bifunctional DNA primase/polymerase-like protein
MLSTTDTESSKPNPTTNLDWALKYAKMGLRVFPLQPGTEIPMTAHGVKDATDDPTLIKEWSARTQDAGIGLAARAQHDGEDAMKAVERKLFGGI